MGSIASDRQGRADEVDSTTVDSGCNIRSPPDDCSRSVLQILVDQFAQHLEQGMHLCLVP